MADDRDPAKTRWPAPRHATIASLIRFISSGSLTQMDATPVRLTGQSFPPGNNASPMKITSGIRMPNESLGIRMP